MYHVREDKLGPYTIYELKDNATGSWLRIAPERGGIVIGLGLQGEELLYFNEDSFLDPKANVRGGIPVLFPICGQLPEGKYDWGGRTYTMKNHGVARTEAWRVERVEREEELSITLMLRSNEETKQAYPFDFELWSTYRLDGEKGLTIEQEYWNMSDSPMPMYAGFHPYFQTAEKSLAVGTDARTLLDYNDHTEKLFNGMADVSQKEAVALLDAKSPRVEFPLREIGRRVTLAYEKDFRYVMLWSEAGKDFVCVEPWMALTNAFGASRNEVRLVEPGGVLRTSVTIMAERVQT